MYQIEHDELFAAIRSGKSVFDGDWMMRSTLAAIMGREAAYRFMTAVAGDLPGYEEATRMLFAGDWTAFDAAVEAWPDGVREHVRMLADRTWRNGEA